MLLKNQFNAAPPPYVDLVPTVEVLETGIKVIDLLVPFAKGGKVGLFGGAGVGKTVNMMELIVTSLLSTVLLSIYWCG